MKGIYTIFQYTVYIAVQYFVLHDIVTKYYILLYSQLQQNNQWFCIAYKYDLNTLLNGFEWVLLTRRARNW